MQCTERTPEQERAYWDREQELVEAANRRDETSQYLMQAQFTAIHSTVRTTRLVKLATFVTMLLIIALAVLILVRLGLAIAGWVG